MVYLILIWEIRDIVMMFIEIENIVNKIVLLKYNSGEEVICNILSMLSLKYVLDI